MPLQEGEDDDACFSAGHCGLCGDLGRYAHAAIPRWPQTAPRPSFAARQREAAAWEYAWTQTPPAPPQPRYASPLGPYILGQCHATAWLVELAGHFRDAGGTQEQFLALMERAVEPGDTPAVQEDKRNKAHGAVLAAYGVPCAPGIGQMKVDTFGKRNLHTFFMPTRV